MKSLAELMPSVYSQSDKDGSFGYFVSAFDSVHEQAIAVIETLPTIRIPDKAPLQFVTDIADAMGNPFQFMTADRWKRGNKLDALTSIYAARGSKVGIENAVRFLCGVDIVVEADTDYTWILGPSPLGGAFPFTYTLQDTVTGLYYILQVTNGELLLTPTDIVPDVLTQIILKDLDTGLYYSIGVANDDFQENLLSGIQVPTVILFEDTATSQVWLLNIASGARNLSLY